MQQKKEHPPRGKQPLEFLKNLKKEDEMIDDHGSVIIGGRDRKPRLPSEEEKETE